MNKIALINENLQIVKDRQLPISDQCSQNGAQQSSCDWQTVFPTEYITEQGTCAIISKSGCLLQSTRKPSSHEHMGYHILDIPWL